MFRKSILTLAALAFTSALAMADVNPEGIWKLDSGAVTVKVVRCGKNICANIVDLASKNYPDGTPLRDALNPNKSLRNRFVIGLPVIKRAKTLIKAIFTMPMMVDHTAQLQS
jgi:Uncharacterized protein conserved in bacteria (DUF2147)